MKNNRALLISIITIVALFICAIVIVPQLTKKTTDTDDGGDDINTSNVDISKYNPTEIISPNADNGYIGDHIKGNKDAKVLVFEYADYQCSACALFSGWLDNLIDEYDGDFAVVYRTFPITSIHPNAIAAASAVEAAGLQGYWEEYGKLVFDNQAEWFYATGSKRTEYFADYFKTISGGKGDVDKFKSDMAGDAVKAKVNFDKSIAESLNISGTPTFFDVEGKEIEFTADGIEQTPTGITKFFREYINKKLGK